MYETSHSTVTTRIRNEIESDDPPLKYTMRQIEMVTKRMATAGAPKRFFREKNLGIMFTLVMPSQIWESPFTVEFCAPMKASAETTLIHTLPKSPRRLSP